VLGYSDESFIDLRRRLIGSSTVPRVAPKETDGWGHTCLTFIERVKNHQSKASSTYYYKNHLQYFDGLHKSLAELARVLTEEGRVFWWCKIHITKTFIMILPPSQRRWLSQTH
jgi:hypothetical protein